VPDPVVPTSDSELRAHVERVLSANYELDREIGRGGMGIVYKARDRRLKRSIAVKLLPPELAFRSEIRTRFLREAETAAQLSHPNIVPIYAVDERDGLVYFVMAYVEGENLGARLHREGRLSFDETRRVLLEVARALAYAHERGVVHRDIKPDNILIDRDGRVMVTDFGIARAVSEGADSRLTATGMAIGTPAYMSPEQSMGEREIDGRSDLYSLGVVGYQMLTGEPPFQAGSTPALLVKHLSERPAPVAELCPDVPSDLDRAVMIMLEKEPDDRFSSAGALATALETGDMPELPVVSRSELRPPSGTRPAYRRETRELPASDDLATREERARWDAPTVKAFRKKLAPWLIFGGVSVGLSIIGAIDIVGLWGLYTIYMAWKYAKIWTEGYDWRDVLKEPRDRLFFDVVAEWMDNVFAIFDPKKRALVRERNRLKSERRSGLFVPDEPRALPSRNNTGAALGPLSGKYATVVREAHRNRDEINRLIETLPKSDKQLLADVPSTASALVQRIEGLALNLAELERSVTPDRARAVDDEIETLEAQANPLDHRGSEERVRRLAFLKRERRALADLTRRRDETKEKLESCSLAVQNLRLDVLRLKAGRQTHQHITLVAEQAMALAREVDNAVYVAEEMAKLKSSSRTPQGRAR
jgi:eukaryotic-like serine/threonine-protein kinase